MPRDVAEKASQALLLLAERQLDSLRRGLQCLGCNSCRFHVLLCMINACFLKLGRVGILKISILNLLCKVLDLHIIFRKSFWV